MLSKDSHLSSDKSAFEWDVLNIMQAVNESLVDAIFKSNMDILYNNDNDNHCYQLVIFNILKHICTDICVMYIIKKYKQSVLNFIL